MWETAVSPRQTVSALDATDQRDVEGVRRCDCAAAGARFRLRLARLLTPTRWLMTVWLLMLSVGLPACSGGLGGDDVETLTLVRLEIAPGSQEIHTGDVSPAPVQFTATAYWSNGVSVPDVAATWRSSNANVGSLDGSGLFTPADAAGGITYVTGAYLGQEASAVVTVVLEQTFIEDGLSPELVAAVQAGEIVTDDAHAPFLLYPFDTTILPRNIARLDVSWDPATPDAARAAQKTPQADAILTVLDFTSTLSRTRVLTTADHWIPSAAEWASIAATNSGGEVTLLAMGGALTLSSPPAAEETPDPSLYALSSPLYAMSRPLTFGISRLDTTGAIYYWSISDRGIKRISNETQLTQDFFVSSSADGGCVSCHTLSPTGDRMSIIYPDPSGGYRLGLLGLTPNRPPEEIVDFGDGVRSGRGAFSPDGKWFLGIDNGVPSLFDGRTGDYIQPVSMGFEKIANVSFSPEGDEVVFAVPSLLINDSTFYDARIATIPFDDGLFGEPVWLTPKAEGHNQYYPTYSPDGNWIAYNQSVSTGLNQPEGDSLMDASSQVYLIARGGGSPILLRQLGTVDPLRLGEPSGESPPTEPGVEGYANSLPVWGPLPDADLLWLSFTSYRGFGHDVKEGIPQIWLSAIEPSRAEKGQDPSHPPFWLPLQDPTTHNHIPQWGPY